MPDFFDNFDHKPPELQQMAIDFLEQRNADPERQAILASYLSEIAFPPNAQVLEVGCASGSISRVIARWPGVGEVIGIEPWKAFIDAARASSIGITNLAFEQADGHALPFEDGSFDAVIFHTTLLHMQDPTTALAEAYRVLRAGGWVSIYDPDPQAGSYAISEHDPLQLVHTASVPLIYLHPWLPRQLPGLIRSVGFVPHRLHSYGTVQTGDSPSGLMFFDSSVDQVAETGVITPALATALKEEARQRAAEGTFVQFGSSVSVIARKAV